MLERIQSIKGIGLFHDADGRRQALKKASLVYADNGRGKSTLSALLRSCSNGISSTVDHRKTIDGTNLPEAILQFSDGEISKFDNSTWNNLRPEVLVFDSDFVERNVHAGGQISPDHRRNLLQFAIGDAAVESTREYEAANRNLDTANGEVRRLTVELSRHHEGMSLDQFKNLALSANPDQEIDNLNRQIIEAENVDNVLARSLPAIIPAPTFEYTEFLNTLSKSIENIDENAEQLVKNHMASHGYVDESWIADVTDYLDSGDCPLCGQSISGLELIDAYRSYFNNAYRELIVQASQLEGNIQRVFSDSISDRLRELFTQCNERLSVWQDCVEIDLPSLDTEEIRLKISSVLSHFSELSRLKQENVLASIGGEVDAAIVRSLIDDIHQLVEGFNNALHENIQRINSYKETLQRVDTAALRVQVAQIQTSKRRYEAQVVELIEELDSANGRVSQCQQQKETTKQALSEIMTVTLNSYKDEINRYLRHFGATFYIGDLGANFMGGGGQATSRFALELRGGQIGLEPEGENSFKVVLSESDKRTLAFAFFIAYINSLPTIDNVIIVLDDPMCSFDLNRRSRTIRDIAGMFSDCEQLIVLAHDAHFLKELRSQLIRRHSANPNDIASIRLKAVANGYSDFDFADFDRICESAYFRSHRILQEYISSSVPASIDVARSIRPVLEGYLRRRFPGYFSSRLLFGGLIDAISEAVSPSPLVYAQGIVQELNDINSYVGQFHHDVPDGGQVQIIEAELRSYVERALELLYQG